MILNYRFENDQKHVEFNLSQLNESEVKELHDFYLFLLSKHRSVERTSSKTKNFIRKLAENPIEINNFTPFKRNEIYER